ncbi:hypothetical protein J8Z82_22350 [Yersinia enterocolitica]|uniref:hypothetical protein n=1 Tax=Yersinia enterocolitica TaxID=630 RepID=UPI001C8DF689|nr:hypothetical protein [Yersinia enterocolitica]MBX9490171.1 hypothetical protein [Yersinia enterocolitica]MBX9494443.1 hypothetical protein [Yersinia enterocolitica]
MSNHNPAHSEQNPENYGKQIEDKNDNWDCHPGPTPAVTMRGGQFIVRNKLPWPILYIYVRHTTSAYGSKSIEFENIPPNGNSLATHINYQTGVGSSFDYWYVIGHSAFGAGMATFESKDNFYCSFSTSDNGTAYLDIIGDREGGPYELAVNFSNSSGCTTSIIR